MRKLLKTASKSNDLTINFTTKEIVMRKSKKAETAITVNSVKSLNANEVVNEIGNLQVSILGTLSGISAKIAEKLEVLGNTEVAITDMQSRLNELYAIEKEAQVLEEIKTKVVTDQENYNKQLSLQAQEWDEKRAERMKAWQREDEERAYENEQRKKKFEDEFKSETEARQRAERIRCDELVKSWNTREALLQDKEEEFKNLQKKVSEIDSLIKAETNKVAAIVKSEVTNSYEHKIQLLDKDKESEKKMFEAREQSLQIQVGQLVEQVAELNKQLAVARQDAKDVTSAALNSASGRQVVEALQRVADKDANKTK
jgi:hypothetical protein